MGKFDSDDDAFFNLTETDDLGQISFPEERGKTALTILFSALVLPLWAFWVLFLLPGKLQLWKEYNFPKYGKVYATGRRNKSSAVAVIYSIRFWFVAALMASPFVYTKLHWAQVQKFIAQAHSYTPNLQYAASPTNVVNSQPQYSLPACSDPSILSEVKIIISNSEKIAPSSVVVSNISETDFNEQSQTMKCISQVTTPNDSYGIQYFESWQDQSAGKWYLQVYHQAAQN